MVKGVMVSRLSNNIMHVTEGESYPIIAIESLTFYGTRYYYFDDRGELAWAYEGTPYFDVHLNK